MTSYCITTHNSIMTLLLFICVGIQFDFETPEPVSPSALITDSFDDVRDEALDFLRKWLDPNAPLQEVYPAPVKQYSDGKQ